MIEGCGQLKSYITDYYKGLFVDREKDNFSMEETLIDGIPQGFDEENALLSAPY
jgi:hypothetical protein